MKLTQKALIGLSAVALTAGTLTACTQNEPEKTASGATTSASQSAMAEAPAEEAPVGAPAANARPDECGLQEQAGPEATFGPFDGGVHFFQPGQMYTNPDSTMKMLDYAESQMHLEFDLKANAFATNWGYSVDETPAALTLLYQLANSEGKIISEGHMMEMNAIDGSHYGTNLAKDTITEPGDYTLTVTIYPPTNYDLHQDYITGPPARGWFKPLTVAMPWKITQENLDIVAANTVENPMEPSAECAAYPVKFYEDPTAQKAMDKAAATTAIPMHMHNH
ncbi:iron transporter [Corynebacterium caspium]|uniref:iron transporter n=1 Tax=Corynebacterium caspium TaxID=234828 RepID=UPI00038230A2|nr:iron transporter [Corynebacterium caspium]WKD59615.1 34 kDa membrane antigen precursor [Corynebacterium caspium DSM 44850]